MSDWVKDNWEDEEEVLPKPVVKANWDDEEDVKESWEDEEEKPKPVIKKEVKPVAKPQVVKDVKDMTEEEKKEAQLQADLAHTQDLFGLSKSLDEISLKTKEDYQDFIDRFYARVNIHSGSTLYVDFLEDLFKTLTKSLPADACKKLANQARITYETKSNEEKQAKAKEAKPKQTKSKARIKMEFDRIKGDFDSFVRDDYVEEGDDDFM